MKNSIDDIFAKDYAKYSVLAYRAKTPTQFEFKTPNNIHSPLLNCIFGYLSSSIFKELSGGTKHNISNTLKDFFDYLNDCPERINQKGFVKDYFIYLKSYGNISRFNNGVRKLRSITQSYNLFNVPYTIEISNILKEIPKSVPQPAKPRLTLGDKLLGSKNSTDNEKHLWEGFNTFLKDGWEILSNHRNTINDYYDTNSESFKILFAESMTHTRDLHNCKVPYRHKMLEILAGLYKSGDKNTLHVVCKKSNPREYLASFIDEKTGVRS